MQFTGTEIWSGFTFFLTVCLLPVAKYFIDSVRRDFAAISEHLRAHIDAQTALIKKDLDGLSTQFTDLRDHVNTIEMRMSAVQVQFSDERHKAAEKFVHLQNYQSDQKAAARREEHIQSELNRIEKNLIAEMGKMRLDVLKELQGKQKS